MATISSTGDHYVWIYSAGTGSIYIGTSASDFQGDISDIEVIAVPGNHLMSHNGSNRPSAGTDGSAIRYLACSLDSMSTIGDNISFGSAGLNTAMLHQPSAGSQGTYAGLAAWSQRTATVHSFNMMGDSTGSVWDWSVWMSDPLTREYNKGTTDSTIQCNEQFYNETAGTWEVYFDGAASATASGSVSNAYALAGSTGRLAVVSDANRNTTFDYVGNIYSAVFYEGARSADLFAWMNTQTGEQI